MAGTTLDATTITAGEQEIYRDYERDRRLRLGQVVARFSLTVLALALAVMSVTFALHPQINTVSFKIIVLGMITGACLWYVLTLWLIGQRQSTLAAIALVGASLLSSGVYQITAVTQQGLTPEVVSVFGAYLIMITVAGLLGSRWLLLSVTGVTNGCAILICYLLPQPDIHAPHTLTSTIFVSVIAQEWAMAGVLLAAQGGLQRTLRELGDTRVQVERARKLEALKDQFISHVNHELRNPIMAWLGYGQNLRRAAEQQMPYALLQTIAVQGEQMGLTVRDLVQSILAARQIDERLEIPLAPVTLRPVMATAIQVLDPALRGPGREVRLGVPPDLVVWGDAMHLRQIITNLVANALKYSPPDTPVVVTAARVTERRSLPGRWGRARHEERPLVEIRVQDAGLGIPPDEIPLLFQRFVRLPRDLASNVPGNGLGLYLCRVYAEAMRGRIRVESTGVVGEGSTFILTLLPGLTETAATPAHPVPGSDADTLPRIKAHR